MHPTLFTWEGLGIHTWGLMIMVAFSAACLAVALRARRVGIDPDRLVFFYLLIPVAGLVGARLLHFLGAEREFFLSHPMAFFDIEQGGFAFYGGVVLGALTLVLYAIGIRANPWKFADIAAPAVMLGLAFGRIGCFFAGCCHGRACGLDAASTLATLQGGEIVTVDDFPWVALIYRRGVGVGGLFDVPLFPTQVWEAVVAFGLFFFLSWMWRKHRRFDGQITAVMLILYGIWRPLNESFRGDAVRGLDHLGALSTSQLVSIPMVAAGLVIIAIKAWGGLAPEAPLVVDDQEDEEDEEDED